MKLYRVKGYYRDAKNLSYVLYIVAESSNYAIKKYLDSENKGRVNNINVEFLCERDDIIPTIEPIIEFKNNK